MQNMKNNVLDKCGIKVEVTESPSHSRMLRKTRGMMYIFDSFCFKQRNIVVAECGTTMYQPKFSPFDEVTLTTHPQIIDSSKKIVKE